MTKIIIVDDQNSIREFLKINLSTETDIEVVGMADNGRSAIAQVGEHQPDLVLMDIEMPVMDGLEATQRILSGRHRPKVVFVTAHALATFHARAVEAGGCGFLTKPINLDKLVSAFSSIDLHMGCRQLRIA